MENAPITVDKDFIGRRAKELLAQRYKECNENGHQHPMPDTCAHCYRHIDYGSDKDPKIAGDYATGIIAITIRLEDGRLE